MDLYNLKCFFIEFDALNVLYVLWIMNYLPKAKNSHVQEGNCR